MNTAVMARKSNYWVSAIALLGIAWNILGVVQFADTLSQTQDSLMMGGMTAEQALVYDAMPAWSTVAFAVGVGGGLIGSIALLLRRRAAYSVLFASLIAYVALFLADWIYGLFAVLASQLAILALVLAIAVLLFGTAWVARIDGTNE